MDACRAIIKDHENKSEAAQLEMRRLEGEAATSNRKLHIAEEKVVHLERSFFMAKANRDILEEWKRNLEPELLALRKFYSDFAYMRDSVDDALMTTFGHDKAYLEVGFLGSQPKFVTLKSLDKLQDILPLIRSVEEAYLWER